MGASRKLQGEIDRVLKKVQEGVDVFDSIWNKVYDTDNVNQKEKFEADLKKEIKKLQRYRDQIKTWIQSSEIKDKKISASYEQSLVDARKQIEREMERFKICEKETKTKAFSKEGLGQQPKTDPKEKAKAETRDWINNVVGELETQIDIFEAEIEGLSVKKGKNKPPRMVHLETSISRHKAHIMKLELLLRLLENEELSPEQVNDVKDFLDDYVERNQDDFDEFGDVDELYSSLPLDKVESLEELVTIGPPGLLKGTPLKTSAAPAAPAAPPAPMATGASAHHQTPVQEEVEETSSQEPKSDTIMGTPPAKSSAIGSAASTPVVGHTPSILANLPTQSTNSASATSPTGPNATSIRAAFENVGAANSSSNTSLSSISKEDENINLPSRRPSPSLADAGTARGMGRGALPSQSSSNTPLPPVSGLASSGSIGLVPSAAEIAKRNILVLDDRLGSGATSPSLVSPLSNRMILNQSAKPTDGTGLVDSAATGENNASLSGRTFPPPGVSGIQWRPGSSFNQTETGQLRGRTEIAPDQREKFLQRLQQVQQGGHSTLLGISSLTGGSQKQFSAPQQNTFQQFGAQTPTSLGLGLQSPGLGSVSAGHLQQSIHQQIGQQTLLAAGQKNSESIHDKVEEHLEQQSLPDESAVESASLSGLGKNSMNEGDLKSPNRLDSPGVVSGGSIAELEPTQMPRDIELSPGQPFQSFQPSGSIGVIGRRIVPDLGTVGDNISAPTLPAGPTHDQLYNLQMLEAAYHKLPQPKDSERARSYIPKHPVATPSSYPQVQAPIVNNPAFWERLGMEPYGADTLFFSFYYQQNTYQQYLAAKELKKQSWRYHKKYNTWFQRHEEPKVTTDEYEQGTYVYFDFHIANDDLHNGWCQRIKTEFTFEYNYLEDELMS